MKKLLLLMCCTLLAAGTYAQPCVPNTSSGSFDGVSNYVQIATNNGLTITGNLTVEAWIYPTAWAVSAAQGTIVCKHSWNQGEQGYVLRAGDSGILSFNFAGLTTGGTPTGWVEVLSQPNALTLNTWQHVAGTFDGDSLKIYINGNLAGTTLFQGSIVPSTASTVRIGALSDVSYGPARYWTGNIDEIRIWDREVSQAEINANMMDHLDTTGQTGLKAYWRLNENTGIIAYDQSGNYNTGQSMGMGWSSNVPFNNIPTTPVISWNGTSLSSTTAASYQWSLNGTAIPTGTQQTWIPLVNGSYTVMITDSNGCTATSAAYPFNSVGIAEQGNSDFHVITLPGQSLTVTSANEPLMEAELIDMNGRKIATEKAMNKNRIQFDVKGISSGVYMVRIYTDKQIVARKIML